MKRGSGSVSTIWPRAGAHGQALAHHLADGGRPRPRRIHGELARDIALAGPDGADAAIAVVDVLHRRAEHDPGAEAPRAPGERAAQHQRIDLAVQRTEHSAEHALREERRLALADAARVEPLDRDAVGAIPLVRAPDDGELTFRLRIHDAPALLVLDVDTQLLAERRVDLDARAGQLVDGAGIGLVEGVSGEERHEADIGARGLLADASPFDEGDALARPGQVVGGG